MPAHRRSHPFIQQTVRTLASAAVGLGLAQMAWAQTPGPASAPAAASAPASAPVKKPPPVNSSLDGGLFYQLLIGELALRSSEVATSFELLLDAAKKTQDEQLFRRSTEIALQARAGDQALMATREWRKAVPGSREALRYMVQLLVALNRPADTTEPLGALIQLTPEAERPALIANLPRFFARVPDRALAADLLQKILQPYADAPQTRTAALVATGRIWLAAGDMKQALDALQRAHAQNRSADEPAMLAAEMLPSAPAAEAVMTSHLEARPDNTGMRLVYARVLTIAQRYPDAIAQLMRVTRDEPQRAAPWLTLGALHLELRHPAEAIQALQAYVDRVQAQGLPAEDTPVDPADEESSATASQGLDPAWLLLAQAAEQQGDFKAAAAWLNKVSDPQRAREVLRRRASLMARQGQLEEARALIRAVPETEPTDARNKLLDEVQLLRDAKQWATAEALLAQANRRFPDDVELLYEQSMMSEKLNRLDEMERLLRRVIEIQPTHSHAHNALGYSLAERNIRLPEAKQLIQRALELSPGDPFITDSLGWVEYRLGNRDEAVRLLRTAFTSRPDTEIGAHLGELLWVTNQRDEARRILRAARTKDAANDVLRETLKRLKVDL